MERIAIFAALQWECRAVLRPLRQVRRNRLGAFTCWVGQAPQREVWVMKTGVGVRRATAAAAAVEAAGTFALYVSTGCAGGLRPGLQAGDLAVATALRGHGIDGDLPTDLDQHRRAAAAAQAAGLRPVEGPILCSATVLATAEDKRAPGAAGAIAVEMEGGPIAARAAATHVPLLAVRAVLDAADDDLHVAGNFVDRASGGIRPLALARYVAMHPRAIAELVALARMQRAACGSLERFFGQWLAAQA